jgi:crotonobetainyl-CoA:carnitine CoA-transferase CaiB-like acyl-CoA transferase
MHRLLANADVFLTNLRPDGLVDSASTPRRSRPLPDLVYARGHGYGVRVPMPTMAGYDASAFWARGGIAYVLTPRSRLPDRPAGRHG